MTLAQFVGWNPRKKRAKRGAISRVAEHLGISYQAVRFHLLGNDKSRRLSDGTLRRVQDMIHARIDLSPKKRTVAKREAQAR